MIDNAYDGCIQNYIRLFLCRFTLDSNVRERKMKQQDFLRKQVKLAKELNDGWKYYHFAQIIDITPESFYNWLKGYYELSYKKKNELEELMTDLLEGC